MAVGDFVDNAKDMAKDKATGAKGEVGSAQDEADKEVNGAPQGPDHQKPAGDAADNAADSAKEQADLGV
jgi:hypothetical protein